MSVAGSLQFGYSLWACLRMGMSGSASFHRRRSPGRPCGLWRARRLGTRASCPLIPVSYSRAGPRQVGAGCPRSQEYRPGGRRRGQGPSVPARPWHNPRRFQHSRGFSEIRLPRRCLQCRSYVNEQCNRLTRHWKFLINTASIGLMPRERARRPSRDQSNQKILSEAKCVTGFGRPPATGCSRCYSHHSRCW